MKNLRFDKMILLLVVTVSACQVRTSSTETFRKELAAIDLERGEIALCGADNAQFGKVDFGLSCNEKVRADFNLATALLHSFEYTEAEKIFARVIDGDPECLMAYWGIGMSNFHPLWAPPTQAELEKGSKSIALARSLVTESNRESEYVEAVGAFYDNWRNADHKARVGAFEKAAEQIYIRYPEDREAAVFYALALRAAADPADKSFVKQNKAGAILNSMFADQPDHPGIAHYLIHTYDYPELAHLALPAARKYASIASGSAHALHMPSHIFTRLGIWDESINSNLNAVAAAKCYAENSGMKGHWDEEIHGIDYLVYAYLQQGKDDMAKAQMDYLQTIEAVFPMNNKIAYTFAAVPTRMALERRNWNEAIVLELKPGSFPWVDYEWESSLVSFGKILGAVHLKQLKVAESELEILQANREKLLAKGKAYEANQVNIQIKASRGWIEFAKGNKVKALDLMTEAARMEDATDKHPLTPGEVLPARELLADLQLEMGAYRDALISYEEDLKRHPGRFNGLYGAAVAAQKAGDAETARSYFEQLLRTARVSGPARPELAAAELFVKQDL